MTILSTYNKIHNTDYRKYRVDLYIRYSEDVVHNFTEYTNSKEIAQYLLWNWDRIMEPGNSYDDSVTFSLELKEIVFSPEGVDYEVFETREVQNE